MRSQSYQDIENAGERAHQSVDNDLHSVHLGHGSQGAERSEGAHRLEDGDVSGSQETGGKVDERDADDDEVEPAPRVAEVCDEPHGEEFERRLEEEDDRQDAIEIVETVDEYRSSVVPEVSQIFVNLKAGTGFMFFWLM